MANLEQVPAWVHHRAQLQEDLELGAAKIAMAREFNYLPNAYQISQKANSLEELENIRQNFIYQEPGLKQVAPVAELFGLGLGKVAANAIGKTKTYSDQVVDRVTRMRTPTTTWHGGGSNIKTLNHILIYPF